MEGHDHPEIEPTEEHNTLAERRVRLGLLLAELGQKAEVEVTDAGNDPSDHEPGTSVSWSGASVL